jgi:hypothetical protein
MRKKKPSRLHGIERKRREAELLRREGAALEQTFKKVFDDTFVWKGPLGDGHVDVAVYREDKFGNLFRCH